MIVVTEKREIVGTLKTLCGTYNLLEYNHHRFADVYRFNVVDDEGFDIVIQMVGDFVKIPAVFPSYIDVRRVIAEAAQAKEAQDVEILTATTID